MRVRRRDLLQKFFADRGPHLAAMIAYFALLSFVPLTFLSLSLLGLTGRADESSFLVREIKKTLPGTPIDRIIDLVHSVQDNAATLGIIGGLALLWASLSLFSVLESAFNIVYGRSNRSFLHGKARAFLFMVGSLVTLFVALLAGSLGVAALQEYAAGFISNAAIAYALSIGVSLIGVFVFLVSCYFFLTNEDLTVRRGLAGGDLRQHPAGSDIPGAAALPALRRPEPGAPRFRRAGDPPRLALRDVERHRPRRGDQLVARPPRRAAAGRGTSRSRLGLPAARAAAFARCEFSRFQSLPSSATV